MENPYKAYLLVTCLLVTRNYKKQNMKTGIIQQHNTADRADNMRRLADGIRALAAEGAELIVLQELHNSLYFCQVESVDNFDLAEPIPGPSTDFFGSLAKELGVVIRPPRRPCLLGPVVS